MMPPASQHIDGMAHDDRGRDRHRAERGIGDLTFFSRVHHGGARQRAQLVQAAMAVGYRHSQRRGVATAPFNDARVPVRRIDGAADANTHVMANYAPFGVVDRAAWVALHASGNMST